MIDDLKPYPAMKDSGVPWLREVPEHWAIERLKSSMSNVIQQTAERQSNDLYVALEHVESWTGCLRQAGSDVLFDSQVKRFRSGDVLFGKLRPYLAKVTRATSDGVCVGEFLVLRPRVSNATAPYMEQLLRSKPIIDAVNSSTFGAKMPRADWQFVGGMAIPFPPLPEQAAIVRFLDYVERRIQRCIRAKQKLIKLLEEQKQAIIRRAVTRGLAPNVRLKPSGADWLGDVPVHWEVRRAKQLFREVDIRTTTGTEVLLSLRMHSGLVPHKEVSQVPIVPSNLVGFKQVAPGQIVMNRMRAAIGMFGVVPQSGLVSPDYAVFVPGKSVEARYFLELFKTRGAGTVFRLESKGLGTGSSGFMRLYTDRFGIIKMPVPPIEEQKAIVQRIALETAKLDRALNAITGEVDLVREYRTRLIADVVTGKLDVREVVGLLPEEGQEPESSEDIEAAGDAEELKDDGELGHDNVEAEA